MVSRCSVRVEFLLKTDSGYPKTDSVYPKDAGFAQAAVCCGVNRNIGDQLAKSRSSFIYTNTPLGCAFLFQVGLEKINLFGLCWHCA